MAGHDAVVHFAAESHVDRSIVGPDDFVTRTASAPTWCGHRPPARRSSACSTSRTDEVYGSIERAARRPRPTRSSPRSPYSASKAGSDLIALSYHHDLRPAGHRHPVHRTTSGRTSSPRRSIPLFTTNLLDGKPVPLYGDGLNVRDWLYVDDHCAGVDLVLQQGDAGRDLQHRRRQRDPQPGAGRQAARAVRRGRGDGRRTSPTASATTAATRSTSPRSPRSGGASRARSTRRCEHRRLVPRQPSGGGSR